MREDEIAKFVAMLQSKNLKDIPLEQKKNFLKDKCSEEEIAEILKRVNNEKPSGDQNALGPKSTSNEGKAMSYNSPQAEQRLQQTNQHFWTNALNIASLSIVTSVGVTYLLDKFKDKKDETLRNELKDRLYSNLSENTNRLRAIEIK